MATLVSDDDMIRCLLELAGSGDLFVWHDPENPSRDLPNVVTIDPAGVSFFYSAKRWIPRLIEEIRSQWKAASKPEPKGDLAEIRRLLEQINRNVASI